MSELNRFKRKAIQVEEGQKRVGQYIRHGQSQLVPLDQAQNRRLAKDLTASHDLPHFRRSGMDGYAVQAASTKGANQEAPVRLRVIEELPCGAVPVHEVTPTTASRIMTGAMVPDGADTVVMLEATDTFEQEGETWVRLTKEQTHGKNITPVGLEMSRGDFLLAQGTLLGPGELAMLATFGYAQVPVFQQPRVAIFATGSELLEVDAPLQAGKIRNSNTYMLSAQIRDAGGVPDFLGAVPDEVETAKGKIFAALQTYDYVMTTGGVSVGDYDILTDIFATWDGQLLFNKLMMRPGSVTSVGVWQDRLLFALSGNPAACFVGFELLVKPVLLGAQGVAKPYPRKQNAFMNVDFKKVNAFTRFVRGESTIRDGQLWVRPVGIDQSSVISSLKDADCLIIIPPGGQGVETGTLVEMIPLRAAR